MAETYLGYQQRDEKSYIDWGAIGKKFSDTLTSVATDREKRKAELEAITNDAQKAIQEAPTSEYKPINQFALEFANAAQESMLINNRLLKSGQLSPKDYAIFVQNIKDSTQQTFNIAKKYDDTYVAQKKRMDEGTMSNTQRDILNELATWSQLGDVKPMFDQTTGRVSYVKTDKNGKVVQYLSANELDGRLGLNIDKYDLDGAVGDAVKTFGTIIKTVASESKGGDFTTTIKTKDYLDRGFKEAKQKAINAIMSDQNTLSILTDYMGGLDSRYGVTYDPNKAKADKNLILLTDDGTGNYKADIEGRKKEVASFLDTLIMNRIEKEYSSITSRTPVGIYRAQKAVDESYADAELERKLKEINAKDTGQGKLTPEQIKAAYNRHIDKMTGAGVFGSGVTPEQYILSHSGDFLNSGIELQVDGDNKKRGVVGVNKNNQIVLRLDVTNQKESAAQIKNFFASVYTAKDIEDIANREAYLEQPSSVQPQAQSTGGRTVGAFAGGQVQRTGNSMAGF